LIINLRRRFELAVGKVIGESFGDGPEDVAWWVGLGEISLGPCDRCGDEMVKSCVRVHLDIIDHQEQRLSEMNADLPTVLSPEDIREATRGMVDQYRIMALEDGLSRGDHTHECEG
jgi:hypothetical protein